MSGDVELAQGVRGFRTFPAEWGTPPGTQFSEERARWVKDRVREYMCLKRVQGRAGAEAVKVANFERQRYLHLTRER
jgi:hypothetical protein